MQLAYSIPKCAGQLGVYNYKHNALQLYEIIAPDHYDSTTGSYPSHLFKYKVDDTLQTFNAVNWQRLDLRYQCGKFLRCKFVQHSTHFLVQLL